MTITVLSSVFLSDQVIAAGVRGKLRRKNSRVTTDNGQEFINVAWTQSLREFEVGFVPMPRASWQAIESLFEVTEGGAYGFLMSDPKDMVCSTGTVVGLTSTTFQLYKKYTDSGSGLFKTRKITRPKAADFVVMVSGTPLSGGSFTLNADTGVVTIPSAPSAATVTWTGHFYVPVHFQSDTIDWEMAFAGPAEDARLLAGPSCILEEVRE